MPYYSPGSSSTQLKGSLLVAGFAFGLAETFIVSSQPIWFQLAQPLTEGTANLIGVTTASVSILVDPVLVFTVLFFMGRSGLNLSDDYLGAFVPLFLGAVLGTAISFAAVSVYLIFFDSRFIDVTTFIENGIFFYGVGTLRLSLVGFAGLAMAHFSRSRSVGPGPVPP